MRMLRVKVAALVPPLALSRKFTRSHARPIGSTQKNSRRPIILSAEQQTIVELSRTQNVIVSARPGSGKTATAEAIVAANRDRPIAIITYSKRLQLETARRLQDSESCDVFTFHGMAGKLFDAVTYNDTILRSFRRKGALPKWRGQPYEIVILDELQDCTEDLFWLSCSFISSITHASGGRGPQIVALGDERQAIYGFRGADARYLSHAAEIMGPISPYSWTRLPLTKSFRLSHETSSFVNGAFLDGEEYIVGSHSGSKPIYIHANPFEPVSLARELVPLIRKYGPEQTAILAPYIRGNDILSRFTNYLSENSGIGIAVSVSDELPLDDLVIGGKVCVSTYHQFKGNERDLVIVYGVDDGYFSFIARDLPDDRCPNGTFVALTRARKQLVVLQNDQRTAMPFVDLPRLCETADVINEDAMQLPCPPGRPLQLGLLLPRSVSVTDMARHISNDILDSIVNSNIIIHKVSPPLPLDQQINAPDRVLSDPVKKHYEGVTDLNGLAVLAAYEYSIRGTAATIGIGQKNLRLPNDDRARAIWLCREACKYDTMLSGYKSRKVQLADHSFDWLVPYLGPATDRLKTEFEGYCNKDMVDYRTTFEVPLIEKDFYVEDQKMDIRGIADIVRRDRTVPTGKFPPTCSPSHKNDEFGYVSLWEIKFTTQLSLVHVIQASAYAYLWCMKTETDVLPKIILLNIRDGERWDLEARDGLFGLRSMIQEVLQAKYTVDEEITTDVFLKTCAKVRDEVGEIWARKNVKGAGGWGLDL